MTKKTLRACLASCVAFAALAATGAQAATDDDTFTVSIEIQAVCTVDADSADIDLGTVDSNEENMSGDGSITVKCSNTTPYTVGLAPGNNDDNGAGAMNPAGASPDTVPYQLRSTAGASGTVWGNVAANDVAGTGTGADQTIAVFVTAPSANYAPDSYSDTVTVTVNY